MKELQEDVETLMRFMTGFDPEHACDTNEKFNLFLRRVKEGPTGYYSTELALIYGPGKRALDELCLAVERADLPLERRLSCVRELARNIDVCASGTSTNLMLAAQGIQGGETIVFHARKILKTQIEQAILEFVRAAHGDAPNYKIDEMHYVNGYHNYVAARYGLDERMDNAVPPAVARQVDECAAHIAGCVSGAAVVRQMAEELLQELQGHLGPYVGRPMTETEYFAVGRRYTDEISISIKERYGAIAVDLVFSGQSLIPDAPYALIDDTTLLARAIAKNLMQVDAGILQKQKFAEVAQAPGGGRIKLVGDAFYVKTGSNYDTTYRPLDVLSLPVTGPDDGALQDRMTKAALTSSPLAQISGFDPKRVWAILERSGRPFETFSGPEVRRYRRASAANQEALFGTVLATVNKLIPHDRDKAFLTLARNGESELALRILSQEFSIDCGQRDSRGNTALHYAARHGNSELVRKMAGTGLQIDALGEERLSALMLAARNGHAGPITALLADGAKPDQRRHDDVTPLMIAAEKGHTDAITALLAGGADPALAGPHGITPVLLAARKGDASAISALLDGGANPNPATRDGFTPLMIASQKGHADAIKALLAVHPHPNLEHASGATLLMFAAQNDRAGAITALIGGGANPNLARHDGVTPLMIATRHGRAGAITALLAGGASPDLAARDGLTPLMSAAQHGHAEAIKALLAGGASPNQGAPHGLTPLMLAARYGRTSAIRALLDGGADPNLAAQSSGDTPLIIAVCNGQDHAVEALLEGGANPNHARADGTMPATLAAQNGNNAVTMALRNGGSAPPLKRRSFQDNALSS